jgi:hydrogenase expression/formation protein HypD
VTPLESIDFAIELARMENVELATFGDMLRVPGSRESLLGVRASGGNVQIVYSPLDAVKRAEAFPDRQIVFFAVGFETTTPATALAVQRAAHLGLNNFSLLVSHVCVLPAMELIAASPDSRIDGFLAAGHVCTITGHAGYGEFVERFQLPVVVTGFEPVDLLTGILECVQQLERGHANVANCYRRSVAEAGNRHALQIVNDVYEICDRPWRGFGVVPSGGFRLRNKYSKFDARSRFDQPSLTILEPPECRSHDVLTGKIKPHECECFGNRCTPESPLGAPMVSSEGSCAAYYRYADRSPKAVES